MQLPKRVREGAQLLAEDALIVIGVSLAAVGIVELSGWSSKELLQGYTPLLLAMFSIIVTVSALRLSIKESRDRALRERNDAVRPVLIAEAVGTEAKKMGFFGVQYFTDHECIVDSGVSDRNLYMKLENAGLGVARNVQIFIRCANEEYYLVAYEVPKIAANDAQFVRIRCFLPALIGQVVTRCWDIFENVHYCVHGFCDDYVGPDQMVIGNSYIDSFKENKTESDKMLEALKRRPLTREVYMTYGYTVAPKTAENETSD